MTNKEAARTLLYGLSRETSKDKYIDAICMAICALMREEEACKGKHEETRQKEPIWHSTQSETPIDNIIYFVKINKDDDAMWHCQYRDGKWYLADFPDEELHVPIKWFSFDYNA